MVTIMRPGMEYVAPEITLEEFGFSALIGDALSSAECQEYHSSFGFDGGVTVSSPTDYWRLVSDAGVIMAGSDHGARFGFPSALDAGVVVLNELSGRKVTDCAADPKTGDLSVHFGTYVLQFFCGSRGYESWHAFRSQSECICLGGGKLRIFRDQHKPTG